MTDYTQGGDEIIPSDAQKDIIQSDEYPMRVLAGAGTGKTFTMVRKIERLIDQQGVDPDRILALTFTNKAADSMQTKLGEKIGARGYDIDAYTYHSICHRLLTEYAYHTGLDPQMEVASETDKLELILEVLDEVDYRFISPEIYDEDSYGSGAETKLTNFISSMKSDGTSPEDLREFLGDPDTLRDLQQVIERIDKIADDYLRYNWRKITSDRLSELHSSLECFRIELVRHRDQLGGAQIQKQVTEFLDAYVEVVERLQKYIKDNEERIVDGDLKPVFKIPAFLFGAYSSPPSGVPELGFTLTDELASFIDLACQAHDLTQAYAAYETRLREESLLDFDDLVLETLQLLSEPSHHSDISGQWDYVFCDEFQDTDSIQFDLVERLSDDGNLFVVGDDDQAIYEWRGANIENIGQRLSDTFPELTDESLEENFRSKQSILDLANNAIERLEGRSSDKELEATGEKRGTTEGVATVSGFDDEQEQADRLTRILLDLTSESPELTNNGYDFGDIAILVRKKRHASEITDHLRDAGIPYEFPDSGPDITVGVGTVLAFLDTVADPTAEVSLNRVLTMRYRLHDRDLRTLNSSDHSLATALSEVPADELYEPDRVKAARDDLTNLWSKRDTHTARGLYTELKETTDIQWYLSEQERRNLGMVDRAVEAVSDRSVQTSLTKEFVESVRRHIAADEGLSSPTDQSEKATGAVNIMTVHKSKGLDFPVVMLPSLSADDWDPKRDRQSFDALASYAKGESPLDSDLLAQDLQESRRVFHVAVTRAEDQLVLFGQENATGDGDELPLSVYREILPPALPYSVGRVEFPIWNDVLDSLPDTAEYWSERALDLPTPYGNAMIETSEGNKRQQQVRHHVLDLARQAASGDLSLCDPAEVGIRVSSLDVRQTNRIKRKHSYTSLESVETCSRQHYLNYVVRAFDDHPNWSTGGHKDDGSTNAGSVRARGILFHEVAEHATKQELETLDEWLKLCGELARKHDLEHVVDEANQCIRRFFETPVADWDVIAAEREFSINIGGSEVTGLIDAVCEKPDNSLVALDYKATKTKRDLQKNIQIPLYLLACEKIFDRSVDEGGYVYVGETGPTVETRMFSEDDKTAITKELIENIRIAEKSTFDEFSDGEHCRYCSHRSLPCAANYIKSDQ